jgi:serine protease Do
LLARVNTIQNDVASLESSTSELQGNLSTLGTSVDNLGNRLTNVEDSTANLGDDVNNIKNSIDSMNSSIDTINSNIDGLNSDINDMAANILDLQKNDTAIMDIIAAVEPTVVYIEVASQGSYYSGSGVIIRSNGYILTNYHVIEDADSIAVQLSDETIYGASVINTDELLDIAVIKINSTRTDFPVATLGSSSSITIGEGVIAMGFPLGLPGQATFTYGIVSAIRNLDGYNWIQTDAAINHGNSGGPLVNLKGEVIGINSAIIRVYPPDGSAIEGINLAIPIDDAKYLINDL